MNPRNVFLGLLLTLLAAGAKAEVLTLQWDANRQFAHEGTLAPGKFLEVCGKLAAASRIDWSFQASAPPLSNVHYHQGKEVIYPARHPASSSLSERLVAPVDQEYCWMWTNRSDLAAKLSLRLVQAD